MADRAHRGGFRRLSTTGTSIIHMSPRSRTLPAFAEGFADTYAELRYLRPGDAQPAIVPDVHHDDRATEVKRAYELANCATHEWVSWGLAPYKDEGHDLARNYVSQVPAISDHDTAHRAEDLLGRARDLLSGHSHTLVSLAQQAAAHAAEIDSPIPSEEAVIAAAHSAGQALAAAGIASGEPDVAITEVTARMEKLR